MSTQELLRVWNDKKNELWSSQWFGANITSILVGLWFGKEGREQKPFVVLIHHSHHFCLCSLILQSASLSASTSASSLSSFPLKLANTCKGRSHAPGSSSRRQRHCWVGSALPWWQAPASSSWRHRAPWSCEVSPPSELVQNDTSGQHHLAIWSLGNVKGGKGQLVVANWTGKIILWLKPWSSNQNHWQYPYLRTCLQQKVKQKDLHSTRQVFSFACIVFVQKS